MIDVLYLPTHENSSIIFNEQQTTFCSYVALGWIFDNKNQPQNLLGCKLGYSECWKN